MTTSRIAIECCDVQQCTSLLTDFPAVHRHAAASLTSASAGHPLMLLCIHKLLRNEHVRVRHS